jgi:hypothetical protein
MDNPCGTSQSNVSLNPDLRFWSSIFYRVNDLHNLRGNFPILKPDAANPRPVDAVVRSSFLSWF